MYVFVIRFDLKEKKWSDINVIGDSEPSTRYGHSAVLYQVCLAYVLHILLI